MCFVVNLDIDIMLLKLLCRYVSCHFMLNNLKNSSHAKDVDLEADL